MRITLYFTVTLVLLLTGCYSGKHKKYSRASVYVVAHHDDWQLFMGRDFYNDAADTNQKVVLILTTSGCSKQNDYCIAREAGVLASIKYATCQQNPLEIDSGYIELKNFRIPYFRTNNVVALLLRLPDGNTKGEGFAEFGNVSLVKLQKGKVKDISSTDSLNRFKNWI